MSNPVDDHPFIKNPDGSARALDAAEAVESLFVDSDPKPIYVFSGTEEEMLAGWKYEQMAWNDENIAKPTKAAVDAEIVRLKTKEYQRNRWQEYPPIHTQLDKIYHDGIDKWKTEMVDPVKAKFPKP